MIKIAIVEDEDTYARVLMEYLYRVEEAKEIALELVRYKNAVLLLEGYTADYNLIFMDIRMPYLNGMDAAHKLRELDSNVLLIFITSMTQYAIKGYEVDALDYILKPIGYYEFELKFARALQRMHLREQQPTLIVPATEGKVCLKIDDIRYIETSGHHVIYHTKEKEYKQYATLATAADKLEEHYFYKCNSCYLVNLKYVQKIKGYLVTVDGKELQISQPKKKDFVRKLMEYAEEKNK